MQLAKTIDCHAQSTVKVLRTWVCDVHHNKNPLLAEAAQ